MIIGNHTLKGDAVRCWRIAHSEASIGWGGQERRIMTELTGFRKRGSSVFLFAPKESQIAAQALKQEIPVTFFRIGALHFAFEAVRLARILRTQKIHILNPHSSRDGWLLGIAGRLAGVPLIIRSRHFDVPVPNRLVSSIVYRRLADHIVTTSPKVTESFCRMFALPTDRVSTVSTGVDLDCYTPLGNKAVIPGLVPSIPVIGIIAIIRKAKGHEFLLRAGRWLMDRNIPANFVIVGDGPGLQNTQQLSKELGLERHTHFLGHRSDVPDILRALDLLVIPSIHEGIPQIGLQALASQTPVIASNVGGLPSIIAHGKTGRLTPPGESEALALAIKDALEQRDSTKVMAARGLEYARANHGIPAMLNRMEAIYRQYLPG